MDLNCYQERAPRTPPLTEFRNHCSSVLSTPEEPKFECAVSRHRKTRSGIPEFDPEDLLDCGPDWIPSESPPPFFKHSISVLKSPQPSHHGESVSEKSENDDEDEEEVESLFEETSIPLPPTPSCGVPEMVIQEGYEDSDQETCIADSVCSFTEDDSLSGCNMDETLLEDANEDYLTEYDELLDFGPENEFLPTYVGLDEINPALLTIPEDHEVLLDKFGNHIAPEQTVPRASLQSIEMDAFVLDLGTEIERSNNLPFFFEDSIRAPVHASSLQEDNNLPCSSSRDNKAATETGSSRPEITPSQSFAFLENQQQLEFSSSKLSSRQEYKRSGSLWSWCPDFSAPGGSLSPVFQTIWNKTKTIGKILKDHWQLVTSLLLPVIVLFTYNNKSSSE